MEEPGGLAREVQRPVAILSLQSRVCLSMLRGMLGASIEVRMGKLVPNFSLILSC